MVTQARSHNAETSGRAAGARHATPPPGNNPDEEPVTLIRPAASWKLINACELWQYRELAGFLAWRDVKVRYKQTVLGAAWAILQPAMMMVVFTIVFDRLARLSAGDVPYPLFSYAGLLPWTFFATAVAAAGNSVVGSERLVTKIYFPRLIVPFAAVGAAAVDFFIAFGLLLALMIYYGVSPASGMLLVPLIFLPIALTALGVGTLLAALNVSYRDFRYVIPFLLQLWMFATPSIYMPTPAADGLGVAAAETPAVERGSGADPDHVADVPVDDPGIGIRSLLALNPMIALVAAFRAATLGGAVPWAQFGVAAACSFAAMVVGCLYFRSVEDTLADVI